MTRPLNHAIIVSHPSEKSFTLAIAQRYAEVVRDNEPRSILRDLYRLGSNPVLQEDELQGKPAPDVVAEWALLRQTDVFVLVYPIWFGAMMMGYIDCVFGAGRTRGSMREEVGSSIAQGKQLVSSTLSGSMSAWFHEKGVVVLLRNLFDRYLVDVFGLAETHDYHFDGIQPGLPSATMHFIWPTRRTRQRKSWPAMRGRTISWLAMRGLVSEELNTVQLRERMPRVSARFDY